MSAPRSQRPNIIFLHTDSMDGRMMGCMGHREALGGITPNLDRLAEGGVLFRNAYTNNPICCPSRASMWSGRYTHHCEAWNNYKGLADSDRTLFDELRDAGYRMELFGKLDYLSGGHSERARVSAWTRSAEILRPNYRVARPEVIDTQEREVHGRDWRDVASACRWLREDATSDSQPFFLYLGIRAPHPEFRTSRRYFDRIDEAKVDIPKPDGYDHPVLAYQRVNRNWTHGFSDDMVRLVRRVYFAMIAEVDEMVGDVLAAADELRLGGSTYIIFSSDHGELAMEHRQWYKMSPYEASARIPLVVSGPDVRRGTSIEAPVSLVDIYPTFTDIAAIDRRDGLDGHSLVPECVGGTSEHPGWTLTEYHDTSCSTGMFMLREGTWKYVVYVGHSPQLFDLAADPDEVRDRASERPDVAADMDRRLRRTVDCEAVDAKVKAYDRASFRRWRDAHRGDGTYRGLMTRIFSGFDDLREDDLVPWTDEDERRIDDWLGEE